VKVYRSIFSALIKAIFGVNLLLFIHYIGVFLVETLVSLPKYQIYDGVGLYFNFNKKRELILYVFDVFWLFWSFVSYIGVEKRFGFKIKRFIDRLYLKKYYLLKILAIGILLPVIASIFGSHTSHDSDLMRGIVEILIFIILYVISDNSFLLRIQKKNQRIREKVHQFSASICVSCKKWFYVLMIVVGFFELAYLFYDPLINKPKIANEYYAIPEKTIIDNRFYDNTSFFNKNIQSPLTYKYDIISGDSKENVIPLDKSKLRIVFSGESSVRDSSINQIFYDKNGRYTSFNLMRSGDCMEVMSNDYLYALMQRVVSRSSYMDTVQYGKKVMDFLDKNRYEIHQQVLGRYIIHHHNFVLSPVNELSLGKEKNQINAQYGLGSAILINKLLSYTGGVSLHNWLKWCYLFYIIYFLLFVVVVNKVSESVAITSLVFIASLIIINNRGYDILLMPPGESPWRHFFDVVVLYFIYRYGVSQKLIYYVIALILSVASVYINPQIGMMVLLSVIAAGMIYSWHEKHFFFLMIALSCMALLFGIMFYLQQGAQIGLTRYYIDGLVGIKIDSLYILGISLVFLMAYMGLYYLMQQRERSDYFPLAYLLFYSQALMLYTVWHFDRNGITSRFFIYILTVILLVYKLSYNKNFKWQYFRFLKAGAIFVFLLVYLNSLLFVLKGKKEYDDIFKSHKVYSWGLKRADIVSTIDPIYFKESIDLIRKYSLFKDGIYIISKYDNILPFLSEKYTEMPFIDMSWYFVTNKEVRNVLDLLRRNKPEYIYVDTDIYRNYNNDLIDIRIPKIGYLSQESAWRVQRMKLLNLVFEGISNDYSLCEKGILISVYKRK